MLASYVTIVRRAAVITTAVAAVLVAVNAAASGLRGLTGALAGVGIVVVFFGLSILIVGRAAKVSPAAMMIAAIVTYLVKIVGLAFIVSALHGTASFSTRALGITAIGCILAWSAAQVVAAARAKMLYVVPDGKHP